MSRIEVTIDRVVLKGIDPAERNAFADGLRSELSRMLGDPASRAAWRGSRRTPVLRVGKMALEPGHGGARRLGRSVARAIGRGIKP